MAKNITRTMAQEMPYPRKTYWEPEMPQCIAYRTFLQPGPDGLTNMGYDDTAKQSSTGASKTVVHSLQDTLCRGPVQGRSRECYV